MSCIFSFHSFHFHLLANRRSWVTLGTGFDYYRDNSCAKSFILVYIYSDISPTGYAVCTVTKFQRCLGAGVENPDLKKTARVEILE